MAYTNAGLVNDGYTTHYSITYDSALSQADGVNRANALVAACEADFALMQRWFGGIDLPFPYPIPVQIENASGGASASIPAPFLVDLGSSTTVELKPGAGKPVSLLRYLLVSEVTELFMLAQDRGWFYTENFFQAGDEGSKGEGLSRFLASQFLIQSGLGPVPPPGFGITGLWLNSSRGNFVDNNPDDKGPDPTNGCTTLFLWYLFAQLGFSIERIVAAASSSLAGVYTTLTGKSDGWTSFSGLVNSHYPPPATYTPLGDSVFPVSDLASFWAPNEVTCGYSNSTAQIFLDRPAMAQVNIQLTSDDPGLTVPPVVTVPVGFTSTTVTVQAAAIAGPFAPKDVLVHATYAGKTLTMTVTVVPPTVATLTISPDSVVCGNASVGTVSLNLPSLLGPVTVDLASGAPGFAAVPPQVTIAQNEVTTTFPITTPVINIPFPTAKATIVASYATTSVSAVLIITPVIVAGIVHSLTLFPSTVTGGNPSHGTVTLEQAVPTDTVVGLAALQPGMPLPGPGPGSSDATVPPSITIPAGLTGGGFQVATRPLLPPMLTTTATIMAAAVVEKYAILKIDR